jgi:predicted small metal-binding protein
VDEAGPGQRFRVGCACGWDVSGTENEVVPAVLEHGERVHNMRGTREAVLANAERLDDSGVDWSTGRPGPS